jgi:zinc transport system substrate-binding protein
MQSICFKISAPHGHPAKTGYALAFMAVLILILFLGTVSCSKKEEKQNQDRKLQVVTTLFPLYDFAKNIGSDKAEISLLLPPGMEAHSFEPTPGDVVRINSADIFIFTGNAMEPWVANILKGMDQNKVLICRAGKGAALIEESDHHHGGSDSPHGDKDSDPHIWLDFSNARKMVDNILENFIVKDPSNRAFYSANAEHFKTGLDNLDREYRESLSHCRTRVFIHGGHSAFNYLAKRYGLEYLSAYKGSPNSEPTASQIIELSDKMKKHRLKALYYEELITPRIATVLAKETGAALLKLHGAHNITRDEMEKGVTFMELMENNLKNLQIGLECQ